MSAQIQNASGRGRMRVIRGALVPRGVHWSEIETGATNRCWRGVGSGGEWLFKWYRYPEVGKHPEIEVGEFLSRMGFRGVPEFGGGLEQRTSEGDWMPVGFSQRWVDGQSAWGLFLEEIARGEANVQRARSLGHLVGELHLALASGAQGSGFEMEPWDAEARRLWIAGVEAVAAQLYAGLCGERPREVEEEVWEKARHLWVDGRDSWVAGVGELAEIDCWCVLSRVHGDLHLGQVLEAGDGRMFLLDFEGEPIRPLSERRRPSLPLRDVAGIWRSFGYAASVARSKEGLVKQLQEAFFEGWCERMPLPEGDWMGLMAGLVWEKAIYEALYELRHRPAWFWVPLSAL